jgi:hypothetical protein
VQYNQLYQLAPILQGNTLKKSVIEIERFPRTGVDEHTLDSFLGVRTTLPFVFSVSIVLQQQRLHIVITWLPASNFGGCNN